MDACRPNDGCWSMLAFVVAGCGVIGITASSVVRATETPAGYVENVAGGCNFRTLLIILRALLNSRAIL